MNPPDDNNDVPSSSGGSLSHRHTDSSSSQTMPPRTSGRPNYMTVGSGSTSESAAQLAALLDNDSGYGGSIIDGSNVRGWNPGMTPDMPTPPTSHTPLLSGDGASEKDRRTVASHIHQLYYNSNRNSLGRAIHGTIEHLRKFQEMNQKWPAHYPSVQPDAHPQTPNPRPSLQHSSTFDDRDIPERNSPKRPMPLRRAGTSVGEDISQAESSTTAAERPVPEPRLVSAQLSHDFSVLKLELKMGGRNQTDLVHSLEKNSIASLLDGQIQQSIRHLYSLKDRIDDTASKVLVTGDLNAGKSTFCNALLRRKVLPEDQQPCTAIFCEVLDVRENGGIEEVHAVPIGAAYNRHDESTYKVFSLAELDDIVHDSDNYSMCKIYVKDIRSVDESLLNNGVVDIALIDAPGLNMDSIMTTAVFARQEEIDVVVFVVSAANHFTQSAKEFIFNAAREKAYIFMVVNGFDNIRDKKRCQEMILKQVHGLTPATFKESAELVHFVSSNAIPVAPAGGPSGDSSGSGSGGGFGDPDDDGDGDSGKGKGKDTEKMRDFEELEASLRRFVLEKRARSKLAPAKTYLMNLLGDLNNLATVNRDVAQNELARVKKELDELEPAFEQSRKSRTEASEDLDRAVEDTTTETFNYTRETLNDTIDKVAERDLGIPYPGFLSAYQYAEDIKYAMLDEIQATVQQCEKFAMNKAVSGFNGIKQIGLLHVGNVFPDVIFLPEKMYKRPKHFDGRQVDIEVELWDFFDISSLWERQEKVAGTGMAVTVAGVIGGRLIGGVGWVDGALGAAKVLGTRNMQRMIVPSLVAAVVLGVTYALTSIPHALPRRLSTKLAAHLAADDYTHKNAARISGEVRRALRGPSNELRVELQRNVEKLQNKKEETAKLRTESDVARKYFSNLINSSNELRRSVAAIDLEGPPPGLAAQYAS